MELTHSTITSPVFELIGTYEMDLVFILADDEDSFSLRIELFRSLSDKKLFRYKTWRNELFRIQSTFPQDISGKHLHGPSDEMILAEFSLPHFGLSQEIHADTPEEALSMIIKDLGKALEHISGEKLKINEVKKRRKISASE